MAEYRKEDKVMFSFWVIKEDVVFSITLEDKFRGLCKTVSYAYHGRVVLNTSSKNRAILKVGLIANMSYSHTNNRVK